MFRTRQLLSTTLGTLLLLLTAGPALAGPAPLDDESRNPGRSRPTTTIGTGADIWTYAGYAVAVLAVLAVVAFLAIAVDRHAHHAPHPV